MINMRQSLLDKIHNNESLCEDLWEVISELQLEEIKITENEIMVPSREIVRLPEEWTNTYYRPKNTILRETIGDNDIYNFNVRFQWDDRHQAYSLYEGL